MPRCAGFKPNGDPCERIVPPSQTHCYSHDPARQDERQRNATRAGRRKPNREIADIKARLSTLANDVLAGDIDKSTGAVVSQILNVYLRAISTEIKAREAEELAERIAALEEAEQLGAT